MEGLEDMSVAGAQAFVTWVVQYPSLCEYVEQALRVLKRTSGCTAMADVIIRRDAYNRLVAVTWEAGFQDVSLYFYQGYVQCCWMLLVDVV